MGINQMTKEIHENAMAHGWWEEERSFGEIIALCHSELSEALEEYRAGKPKIYCMDLDGCPHPNECTECYIGCIDEERELSKPEGIAVELADCIIRILDYCGRVGIDMEEVIRIKHEYNKTRPYRHGGKII